MIKIALCDCTKIKAEISNVLASILTMRNKDYAITLFDSIKNMNAKNELFDVYIFNENSHNMRDPSFLEFLQHLEDFKKKEKQKLLIPKNRNLMLIISNPITQDDIELLSDSINSHFSYDVSNFILNVLTKNGYEYIPISNIFYVEAASRKVFIKTITDEYICSDNLKNIFEAIHAFGFEKPHNSYIVNLSMVANIKGLELELRNNIEIPISQKKAKEFKIAHKNFIDARKA